MRKIISLFLLCFLFVSLLWAETRKEGVITGFIKDKTEMRSLPGATVKLNKNNRYTFADENLSKFKFKELTENHDFTSDDELAAKINARVPFSVIKDQKGRLRFGLRARLKNKKGDTSLGINILRIDSLSLPGYGWNTRPLITAEISSHRLQSAHLLCR